VQRLGNAGCHLSGRDRYVFETEGDLAIDDVVDGLQLRVLEDESNIARKVPRWGGDNIEPYDLCAARDPAAVKMRDQPVEDAEKRRLASA